MQEPTFGDKLKDIRLSKGDSVRKIALYAGISASYYSQVENGKRRIPKPETLRKIAKGLRISESQIFELANLIPDGATATDPSNQPQSHSTASSDGRLTVMGLTGATLPDNRPLALEKSATAYRIRLTKTRSKLQLPLAAQVHTQLPQRAAAPEALTWLKVTDTDLLLLGILKNDLVVVDTTAAACQPTTEHAKLVALNLTASKTTIRRVLLVANHRVMLTSSVPNGQSTFLTLADYNAKVAGAVINIYRDVH